MPSSATLQAPKTAASAIVRPFERADIRAVACLFNRSFRKIDEAPSPKLEAFFADVFFDAPCQQETPLCSFVCEDADGSIGGFVGTHPRAFMLDGKPISAAAYGQLMVAPELRGRGMAFELVKRFYEGGQDYTFCGSAAPATRAINLRLGGTNPAAFGTTWRKMLQPVRSLARRMSKARKLGPLRHLAGVCTPDLPLETDIDMSASLDMHAVETAHERAFADQRFHPRFNADHLRWALRTAATSSRSATLASVVNVESGPVGWYVWCLAPNGTGTVVELLATPGYEKMVINRVIAEARAAGAESIGGLCPGTEEADALRSLGATIQSAESTFVFHARDPQLLQAYACGPQSLGVLTGEGWIDFPR